MRSHPVVWALRLAWLSLPFTAGEALGVALDGRSTPVVVTVAALAWAVWAVVLVATFVAHPVSLTVIRLLSPAAVVATVPALVGFAPDDLDATSVALGTAGLVASLIAAVAALSGVVADTYVDAASYGDERRFALRTPVAFLLGPVPVAWLVVVGGGLAGPVLVAAGAPIPGLALTLVALAAAVPGVRAFHALSRRWLVFVPAGATLVDHLALVDPALFPARSVSALGPALEGTGATDLSQGATGLVLEIDLDAPVEITARTSADGGELQVVRGVLVSPVRPGAVVEEASRRGLGR